MSIIDFAIKLSKVIKALLTLYIFKTYELPPQNLSFLNDYSCKFFNGLRQYFF